MNQFHPLCVETIDQETDDVVVLKFRVPESKKKTFAYIQGQHVTLRAWFNGEEFRRSYSICTAAHDRDLRIAIKRIPGGVFSGWVHAEVESGTIVDVMPPTGHFNVPIEANKSRNFLGFAAGSGITPILSILKTTLVAEPNSHFTLVFCNRTSSSIIFFEELASLKNRYLDRLNIIHILSREQQDVGLFNGRITQEKCEKLFKNWMPLIDIDYAFICGPEAMMHEVSCALQSHGMAQERIKKELFTSNFEGTLRRGIPKMIEAAGEYTITLILDGSVRTVTSQNNNETILEAALKAGIEIPYSCKGGVCATCRCQIIEGKVNMTGNHALEEEEIKRGFILSCRSIPTSKKVTVDFDQSS